MGINECERRLIIERRNREGGKEERRVRREKGKQ